MKRNKRGKTILFSLLAAVLLLWVTPLCAHATDDADAAHPGAMTAAILEGTITNECTFTMPERAVGMEYRILDAYADSYLPLSANESILITFSAAAQGVYLSWYAPTQGYTVTPIDAAGNAQPAQDAKPFVNSYYPVSDDMTGVCITALKDCALSGVRVYAADAVLPDDVQQWREPAAQADLMLIGATPESFAASFSGLIATYTIEHGVDTAIVCMSTKTRAQQDEFLTALWRIGVRDYPCFGDFFCWNNNNYNFVKTAWVPKNVQSFLNNLFDTFQPLVVATESLHHEAENQAVYFTAETVCNLCAKEGSALFGSRAQKLYVVADSGTTIDLSVPLITFAGAAADAVVQSVRASFAEPYDIPSFPIANTYRLYESLVGTDIKGGDLLENIPADALRQYLTPTATPVPTPTHTPSPSLSPSSAHTPLPASAAPHITESLPSVPETAAKPGVLPLVLIVSGLLLSVALLLVTRLWRGWHRHAPVCIIISLLPFILCVAVATILYWNARRPAVSATPTIKVTAQAEAHATEPPAATPTTAPSATPTPSPTPTPDPLAQYFRQPDEPAEVIVVDAANGHWAYRTDTLSIQIDRMMTTYDAQDGKNYPQVNFIAEIRMRQVNAFRSAQAATNRNGMGAITPYILARREHAVLMISGDNLKNADLDKKGILIRDGKFFADKRYTSTMAMYPDLSMRIYEPGETTKDDLLADGVRDAFSFGPTLMRDGVLCEGVDNFRDLGDDRNPRVGVGMIEPGHYIVIVADGRQKFTYSHGMSLTDFAALFVPYGCKDVYNLDGGVSACMIFMGEQINRHGDSKDAKGYDRSFQRRIPDGLIWGYSALVPSENDPVGNTGTNRDGENMPTG